MSQAIRKLTSLAAAALLLASCAKDRTIDDYNHEKVQQEISKIQAVSGSYRGMLVASRDQSPLGAFTVDIAPDTEVNAQGSSLVTLQQASIQGRLTLTDGSGATRILVFKGGAFDPTSGDFRANVQVQEPNGQQATIEISGNISGTTLTGQISSAGFEPAGGSFNLTLNGALPDGQALSATSALAPPAARTYTADVQYTDGGRAQIDLAILNPQTTADQQFLDSFQPVKAVAFGIRDHDHPLASVTFTNGQWDCRTGTLTGQAQGSNGSYDVVMKCRQTAGAGGELDWSCEYSSAYGGTLFTALFRPVQERR